MPSNNTYNPFCLESPTFKSGNISKDLLINRYKKSYGIDITPTVKNLDSIDIYTCCTSGYHFFHPLNLAGDGKFYEKLQEFDWYYEPWKWEHQEALKHINEGDHILEVGPGQGAFLDRITQEKNKTFGTGLELNASAVRKNEKVEIILNSIEKHAKDHQNEYDVVCSFQVLEHVAEVHSFIHGKIEALKPGGKLIICVPNNDSFIGRDTLNVLNMPPHHMGLWNENALRHIANIFPVTCTDIVFEPLERRHFDWFLNIRWREKFGFYPGLIIQKFLNMTGMQKLFYNSLNKKAAKINGHSIFAVFTKN